MNGPTFTDNYNSRLWAFDANGDGVAEAALFAPPGLPFNQNLSPAPLLVYSATAAGFATTPISAVPFMAPYNFPAGDADGDGTKDLMYRERTGLVRILFSQTGGLVIERDSGEGARAVIKKIYRVDFEQLDADGFLRKYPVADLLNISDPDDLNRDGNRLFTFPFWTI